MNALLYEILEVSPNASPAVIKAAYRCLVQMLHPDKNPGDAAAAERLALINRAYGVLADPATRARYDEQAGLGGKDRRGNGRTLPPLKGKTAEGAAKMRPFTFRSLQ